MFLTLELGEYGVVSIPGTCNLRAGGISILWTLFALGLIVAGIHKNACDLRLTGLGLFTVFGFNIFFSDLANLDKLYLIVALILKCVLILSGRLSIPQIPANVREREGVRGPGSHAMTARYAMVFWLGLSLSASAADTEPALRFG